MTDLERTKILAELHAISGELGTYRHVPPGPWDETIRLLSHLVELAIGPQPTGWEIRVVHNHDVNGKMMCNEGCRVEWIGR